MNQANIKEKIFNIQSELELLKFAVTQNPDFDIDEKNWQKIKAKVKRVRKENYKKLYDKK
jgi:hypothetical protein